MYQGSIMFASVTPLIDGAVDEAKLRSLVEFYMENGTDAIVACGITGKSSTVEHDKVVRIVEDQVNKRVPLIAGTGSNATREAIEIMQHARELSADGELLVTPDCNRSSLDGLFLAFKAIADAVALPYVFFEGRFLFIKLPTVLTSW